jgi:quinoprotein relay system zinc metallohydrolase 2
MSFRVEEEIATLQRNSFGRIACRAAWIARSLLAASLLAAGCTTAPATRFQLTEVAKGLFVHFGAQAQAAPGNLGAIANVGFIVGSRCVAVIDTGGSRAEGERLRAAIAATTAVPVCDVINTHMHPDHVFGNAAFATPAGSAAPVEFIGNARLPAALAARSHAYRQGLDRELGDAGAGSTVILPTRTVDGVLELDLGDRIVELRMWPVAHTDNDLTVFDRSSGTLWTGDLLFVDRIPVIDGSINGWIRADEQLLAEAGAPRMIPGHGPIPADWRAALGAQQRYLIAVRDGTRAAIRERRTIAQAIATVARQEQGRWLLFEDYHSRNVTAAYAELEWED